MKNERIKSAREFFGDEFYGLLRSDEKSVDLMIKFAKYHVELALIAASEKVKLDLKWKEGSLFKSTINKKSIIEAYPLNNVK